MTDCAPQDFQYPTTRYSGSKRSLLNWIWEHVKEIKFNSVLDVFGGTGSVSLLFKRWGKRVYFNDLLIFNQITGSAIIENDSVNVSDSDIETILDFSNGEYPNLIQEELQGVFFPDEENEWIDKVVTNISKIRNKYKRSILMSSLFQACLVKRPFNLFHRSNLYMRTAEVKRTFGNKTTWERDFEELLRRYVSEYNDSIFSNGKENKVIGGFAALDAPNGVDLVYIDPPYFSQSSSHGSNYLRFYNFLEGLATYKKWGENLLPHGKIKRIPDNQAILNFSRKSLIPECFDKLIKRFQDNIIVLSYQSEGIPSREYIHALLKSYGKKVQVFEKSHRYVLSRKRKKELLFIAI